MRLFLRSWILVLLWLLGLPARANHLVGGEMTYKYLDDQGPSARPFRYQITTRIYFNTDTRRAGEPSITINVHTMAAGQATLVQVTVPRLNYQEITPVRLPGCAPTTAPGVTLAVYETTVSLPGVSLGYIAEVSMGNRNEAITNLLNPLTERMALSVEMAPPMLPNSSPVFSSYALVVICQADTGLVLNNAYDVDGDRLSYSFGTPYAQGYGSVRYAPGYGPTRPFGSGGSVSMDARTGLAKYWSPGLGTFLLAIDVREYRMINGREVLLSTTRRDIQIVVRDCDDTNQAPTFTAATLSSQNVQATEGQNTSFELAATDPEGQRLTMQVSSLLLDGSGPFQATVNGNSGSGATPIGMVQVRGQGKVTATFAITPTCGMARRGPYDIIVSVVDSACESKQVIGIFRLTVRRVAPDLQVRGDSLVCARLPVLYTAQGPPFDAYSWSVQGGVIQGSATGRSVTVLWPAATVTGSVTVRGILGATCNTDSVAHPVEVRSEPVITGPRLYCTSATTGLRYSVEGPPGAYQWTISGGVITGGQGSNAVEVDVARGVTAVLQVNTPARPSCTTTLSIGPDNSCLAFYNIITPNGDGKNDTFVIDNLARHPQTKLLIFNRWGRQVYQSDDYHNSYDGAGSSAGLYYYLCQLQDGSSYKGWFELVR